MMAWAKPDVLTGWRCIAYNGDDDGGYGIGIEDDKVAGLFGQNLWAITTETVSVDNWYHITMRRSSGTVQFFLNGELLSYSNTTAPLTPSANFTIGNMYDTDGSTLYGDSFDGQIDEVRVYDAALTDQQIWENMCNSLIGDEDDLVAYYNFDNSTGTTLQAFDGSTTNDLTLVNMSNDDWVSSTAFNTWLNTDDGSWSENTNWSDGAVPTLTDNVGIPDYGGSHPIVSGTTECNNLVVGNGVTLTHHTGSHTIHGSAFVIGHSDINTGYFLTVTKNLYILLLSTLDIDPGGWLTIGHDLDIWASGTCTVKSDATGTGSLIVEGTPTGNVTVERFLTHDRWHYISGQTNITGNFSTLSMELSGGAGNDQFYRWEEGDIWGGYTGIWVDILNGPNGNNNTMGSEGFVACKGYGINYITTDKTLSLSGVPYTTSQDITITKTPNSTGEGSNLTGFFQPVMLETLTMNNEAANFVYA